MDILVRAASGSSYSRRSRCLHQLDGQHRLVLMLLIAMNSLIQLVGEHGQPLRRQGVLTR